MRYVPNPTFFAELDQDPGVRDELGRRARAALREAKAIALSLGGSGQYASSLYVDDTRLLSMDPAAHIIEWGSVNNPPYAPLRRSVESTGAVYVDDRRG